MNKKYTDLNKLLYTTDASEYREVPFRAVVPRHADEVRSIILESIKEQIPIIPRGAGTSLGGQVIGQGTVIDFTEHCNQILEVNVQEQYAWVQPGVVRDVLNAHLKQYHLFFAPETSTSNRATLAGMFGNNSCGANTLTYGSTREHVLEAKGFLSDGTFVHFKPLNQLEFAEKLQLSGLEGDIYRLLQKTFSDAAEREAILNSLPDERLVRKSMGYAVENLFDTVMFQPNGRDVNLCELLAGSEGTLFVATELKVKLTPIENRFHAVVPVHVNTMQEVLQGNLIALQFAPTEVEWIDETIINLSLQNQSQQANTFFLQGRPKSLLVIGFSEVDKETLDEKLTACIAALKEANIGHHYPIVEQALVPKVWALRKAGLGILANIKGGVHALSFVEDSAVLPEYLPQYMEDFAQMLNDMKVKWVAYGHISTGEVHKKPLLNLEDPNDVVIYRKIAEADARLVKKYRGTLSGEHGDGRVRGELLPFMVGEKTYRYWQDVKEIFDPNNLLNPHKIVNALPLDTDLRITAEVKVEEWKGYFHFDETDGFYNAVKKCCNSGDCRKSHIFGGVMCPTFQITQQEEFATRGRANLLREFLLTNHSDLKFTIHDVYRVLTYCLACKGCKVECPSQVDMTKLRAEFLQYYYRKHGVPLATRLIGFYPAINDLMAPFAFIYNWVATNKYTSSVLKSVLGFAKERPLPTIYRESLYRWHQKRNLKIENPIKTVYFFCDEFTNRNDVPIGKKAILLLEALGYEVKTIKHPESGRTFMSKGMLKMAKKRALKNVKIFEKIINDHIHLVGLEPSTILSFRDEYIDLLSGEVREAARKLAPNTFTIDEFLASEYEKGNISNTLFTNESRQIMFHTHCYQKALSDHTATKRMLEIPMNYKAEMLNSGCCGMAGSYGYEKKHYEHSKQIANTLLIPAINKAPEGATITACGTSCRHQITDLTHRETSHPIEVLFEACLKTEKA